MSQQAMRKYAYGIVDKVGRPYFAEDCICEDRQVLECEITDNLNDPQLRDARAPYRVVALYFRGKRLRKAKDRQVTR